MLLSEAARSYEADKRIEGFSSQTLNTYRLQAKLLVNYLKIVKMNDITTPQLKEYLAQSSKDLKPISSDKIYPILFFRWSHEEGIT
ncbi:integrase [Oceanobacillus zhaokaii]|uniref:Integrase n=1 Tax=Oceanobacillus zhaokaii TaxID=2052660 RepID=A0A345PGY4_9BACI|nr:integrase [Oceanobacillus zhaokaii]AXI09264.1 integrase [Oceanobacillus zhaokaii]